MPPQHPPGMGSPPARSGVPNPVLVVVLVLLVAAVIGGGAYLLLDEDRSSSSEETATTDVDGDAAHEPSDGSGGSSRSERPDFSDVPTLPDKGEDFPDPLEVPDDQGPVGTDMDAGDVSVGSPSRPPVTGDSDLDRMADDCYQGDMLACDDLFLDADATSPHSEYGYTCGGRVDGVETPPCMFLEP